MNLDRDELDHLRALAVIASEIGDREVDIDGTRYMVHTISSCNGTASFIVSARCRCGVTEDEHWCQVDDDTALVVLRSLAFERTAASRDCEHGLLRRSCDLCAANDEIRELIAENERLRSALRAVMTETGTSTLAHHVARAALNGPK